MDYPCSTDNVKKMKQFAKTRLMAIAVMAIAGTVLVACSDNTAPESSGGFEETENPENPGGTGEGEKEEIENGTADNPFVGNWYEASSTGTHDLFIFNEDNTYVWWYRSDDVLRKTSGTYSFTDTHITLTEEDGDELEYKIYTLTKTELSFSSVRGLSFDMKASTLKSLEDGEAPSTIESGISMRFYYGDAGGIHFTIIPDFGINCYYYELNGESGHTQSGICKVEYDDDELEFGTEYEITVTAYDIDGNEYRPYTYSFMTKGYEGMVNYLVYQGNYYELSHAEMSQRHDYTGTATGTNWKFLTLYSSDETYIRFQYAVPEWEGIDKEWFEGTYNIQTNSEFWKYSYIIVIDGKVEHTYQQTGTLTIKELSGGYLTIDFELDNFAGHYEGTRVE